MRYLPLLFCALVLAGCSRKSAEELFDEGQKAQAMAEAALGQAEQDSLFRLAITRFNAVVEDFPDDDLAESALFRVAELHNNGTRRFLEAIDTYRRFKAIYPHSPKAPVSLFMIGFLYNNELRQYEKAKEVYREFLETYPEHELALSAEAELEFMGKSPEEILGGEVAGTAGGKEATAGGASGERMVP